MACSQLSYLTFADLGDDYLRTVMNLLWFSVNELLKQDISQDRPLASLPEFRNDLDCMGEEKFFSMLREMAADVQSQWVGDQMGPLIP